MCCIWPKKKMWPRIRLSFIHGFSLSLFWFDCCCCCCSVFFFSCLFGRSSIPLRAYILAIVFYRPFYLNALREWMIKKNMDCNVSLLATEYKKINILRTNCKRFSIQLLRLAPRTTIYLFWIHTLPNGSNICFILFYCFFLPLWFWFDFVWFGLSVSFVSKRNS